MHHHPLPMGSAWLDGVGLRDASAFLDVVDAHPQCARRRCGGTCIRPRTASAGDVRFLSTPSTCSQFMPSSDLFALDTARRACAGSHCVPDGTLRDRGRLGRPTVRQLVESALGTARARCCSAGAAADPAAWRVTGDGPGDVAARLGALSARERLSAAAVVDALYARADELVMELDLDDLDWRRRPTPLLERGATLRGAASRHGSAASSTRASHAKWRELGVAGQCFEQLAPWFVAMNHARRSGSPAAASPRSTVSSNICGKAAADGKAIARPRDARHADRRPVRARRPRSTGAARADVDEIGRPPAESEKLVASLASRGRGRAGRGARPQTSSSSRVSTRRGRRSQRHWTARLAELARSRQALSRRRRGVAPRGPRQRHRLAPGARDRGRARAEAHTTSQTSIISKSSLPEPQSGQRHDSGMSSQCVPGAIPSSGRPAASLVDEAANQAHVFLHSATVASASRSARKALSSKQQNVTRTDRRSCQESHHLCQRAVCGRDDGVATHAAADRRKRDGTNPLRGGKFGQRTSRLRAAGSPWRKRSRALVARSSASLGPSRASRSHASSSSSNSCFISGASGMISANR